MKREVIACVFAATVIFGAGCSRARPSEVIVHLAADEAVREYRATLIGKSGEPNTTIFNAGDTSERTFAIIPRDEDELDVMISVRVDAVLESGALSRNGSVPGFIHGQIAHLYFFFSAHCLIEPTFSPHELDMSSWTGGGMCKEPQLDGGLADVGIDAGTNSARFVAVEGTPDGDGSIARPWDLLTALGQVLDPGTTLFMRGGVYRFDTWTSSISGTPDQPLRIEPYDGEEVRIDSSSRLGSFAIAGAHTLWSRIEFSKSNGERIGVDGRGNFEVRAADTHLIDCAFHDFGSVISAPGSSGVEFSGDLFYNNGFKISDDIIEGTGLALYDDPGAKLISDNVFFGNGAANMRVEAQLGVDAESRFEARFEGNASFDSDAHLIAGGSVAIARLSIIDNDFHQPPSTGGRTLVLGAHDGVRNGSADVEDNRIVGGWNLLSVVQWSAVTVRRNLLFGFGAHRFLINHELASGVSASSMDIDANAYASTNEEDFLLRRYAFAPEQTFDFSSWKRETGWDGSSTFRPRPASEPLVMVRRSASMSPRRMLVVIHNFAGAAAVDVDPRGFLSFDDAFQLRFAGDYFGRPVLEGRYRGGPISVPMDHLDLVTSAGGSFIDTASPAPYFGVFFLILR